MFMSTLFDVYLLQAKLYHWLDGEYYNVAVENYLEIEKAELEYDDERATLSNVKFHIHWGRFYDDKEKDYLNEEHKTIINIDIKYLENYDYILGIFTEYVKNIE